MKFLNQKFMKKFVYSKMLLKIVEINTSIHMNIDVCMILILQTLELMKKLIQPLLLGI